MKGKILVPIGLLLLCCGVYVWLRVMVRNADVPSEPIPFHPDDVETPTDVLSSFRLLRLGYEQEAALGLEYLNDNWEPGFVAMLSESFRRPISPAKRELVTALLNERTRQNFSLETPDEQFEVMKWVWKRPYQPPKDYAAFKGSLYSEWDPKFAAYFAEPLKASIRLDEIMWGGVTQDFIPVLDNPTVIAADDASYLDDGDAVFGVEIDGAARAYPKRILGHHEMVRDIVGKTSINGVFCTLCNTMVVYNTKVEDQHYQLGTSGFLYRSNKLMFDRKTNSLWSTIEGKPVVGPLTDSGLQLERLPVVTTTWQQWRKLHPQTDVLSLETGYRRDYREGAAYKEYYATDRLMFPVQAQDKRLANKTSVLALRFANDERLAITADFLSKNPVFHSQLADQKFVVITDASGASRVYEEGGVRFEKIRGITVVDSSGQEWTMTESALEQGDQKLLRLPAHRAFWFAWYSAFPATKLVGDVDEGGRSDR